ncbi:hypothetical protein N478_17830 [Pseudoalteromonas luteoviolacea S4060-1]|uniref:Uncharacterized protein n=1 Tax=Pseudoalteromonas luteoviolacea S4060-1 TaxID=1365257 RepID=A0A167N0U0_9GAMM|nr:hypothetical protein N478_17830 [Pseudoalteromonas luteoviolacea S4060-1]
MILRFLSHAVVALLLLYSHLLSARDSASLHEISSLPTWQSLIHSSEDKAQLSEPTFLLSNESFSATRELELTLELINSNIEQAYCRFPARTIFLKHHLNLNIPSLETTLASCPELKKYIEHVPFDQLELVFASEIFSSATSMMGHIFLKAGGKNFRDVEVNHSLAYFTEITTLNPAKLLTESLVTGMPGFFTVRPFAKDIKQYLEIEQRNLWQFHLKSNDFNRRLLQLHLWELKGAELVYYFQSYNCATLTLELISLLDPDVLKEKQLFVSPVDVVKAAEKHGLIEQTQVLASPKWLLNSIEDELTTTEKSAIEPWVNNPSEKGLSLLSPLSQQYLSLAHPQKYDSVNGAKDFGIDLSDYKHPAKTPQDSAFGVGYTNSKHGDTIALSFLSSGHYLSGDNRQYLHESELVMGKLSGTINLDTNSAKLSEATIYSVKNLTPSSQFNPSWSTEFYLGYRPAYSHDLSLESLGEIAFGFGKSKKLHRDISGYLHLVGGVTSNIRDQEWYSQIKSGLIIDLVNDSKLSTEVSWGSGKWHKTASILKANLVFSWFPSTDQGVAMTWRFAENNEYSSHSLGIEYNHYF